MSDPKHMNDMMGSIDGRKEQTKRFITDINRGDIKNRRLGRKDTGLILTKLSFL